MSDEDIVAATLAGLNSGNACPSTVSNRDQEASVPDQNKPKANKEMLKQKAKDKLMRGKRVKENHKFAVEPSIIQVIKKPRTYMNHSYRDFSKLPAEIGDGIPADVKQRSFPQQVHEILSQDEFEDIISWMPHGRAFRVHVPKLLERRVLKKYFGHTRFSSFLRQLSNYGFKHITTGKDRNCYYHEFMLRGMPHLCKYMPRPRDARRLIPDPENEPDFYAIAKVFPLAGDKPQRDSKESKDKKPRASIPKIITTTSAPPSEPIAQASEPAMANLVTAPQVSATPNLMGQTPAQMAWLENRLNSMRPNLHNSILGLQPQMPQASLVVPPSNLAAAVQPSWPGLTQSAALQTTLDRNAAMLAALQGMPSQPIPSLAISGLVPTDTSVQLRAALLQSQMQRQRQQFGPF